jgi:hypothetical protein
VLSPDDLLAIAGQVARGMQAAHRRGILHRDLKPDNILVRREGDAWSVKVIDFGLAMGRQVTATGVPQGQHEKSMLKTSVAGTVLYAPPEQLGRLPGVGVGPYSDVYTFGRTCCFALFAVPQPSPEQWGTLPEPLADWLGECGADVPGERPPDFEAVLERLDQPLRRMDVELAVPGKWLTRPANEPQAEWEFLQDTPARVDLLSRQVYRLEVTSGVTDGELESLGHLRGLTGLQHLSLARCGEVTDAGLAHVAGLTALQHLDLSLCRGVTDAGLAHLKGLARLRDLRLLKCDRVTDAGLAHLKGLTVLQHLNLSLCEGVTDAGLAHLARLTALQHLDLRVCRGVTDLGLAHLRGLTSLQYLNLRGCVRVTDAGLAHLAGLTSLQHLDLVVSRGVTDAGLAHLRGLTALQHLDLSASEGLTDAGLAHLRGLTALQGLRLWRCERVTDAGLAHLRGLTALQDLSLGDCKGVTDAGLDHLAGLTALRYLDLEHCPRVTDAGRNTLRAALPQCRIT